MQKNYFCRLNLHFYADKIIFFNNLEQFYNSSMHVGTFTYYVPLIELIRLKIICIIQNLVIKKSKTGSNLLKIAVLSFLTRTLTSVFTLICVLLLNYCPPMTLINLGHSIKYEKVLNKNCTFESR